MISTAAVIISADDSIISIAVDTPIAMIAAVFDWPLCEFESIDEFAGIADENSVVESNYNTNH